MATMLAGLVNRSGADGILRLLRLTEKKLSRQNLSLDFVGTTLVLSASREKLKVKRINGYDGQNLIALANDVVIVP